MRSAENMHYNTNHLVHTYSRLNLQITEVPAILNIWLAVILEADSVDGNKGGSILRGEALDRVHGSVLGRVEVAGGAWSVLVRARCPCKLSP